jgi:hypothetical protein
MNISTSLVAVALLTLTGYSLAQSSHFPNLKWKEKESDHFLIRTKSTGTDPARKFCEDVWDASLEILPGLEDDFAKNGFRTPGGAMGAEEAPFRFSVYLVGSGRDYDKVLEAEQKHSGWTANMLRSCRIARNYGDPQNRYNVFCKADPNESGGGGETDLTAAFIHGTGSILLEGRSRSGTLPFWMTAGFGYYIEHVIADRCRVYYIDFEAYYQDDDDAEIVKGGTLGPQNPWPDAIKKLCKEDVRVSLEKTCRAEILTLSPNTSGYIFALTCFLVSNDKRVGHYRRLVAAARDGKEITKELILMTYGYEGDESFEKDWYDFLKSSKFK